jgi:hypothetical protein
MGFGRDRPLVVASGALDRARLAAWVAILLALAAILAGIPAATRVARASGRKDPQFVVIDEVAGQLITLIAAPIAWQSLLLGFILFRGFDIVKPWPVRRLERLPEGVGIVVDDVAAGTLRGPGGDAGRAAFRLAAAIAGPPHLKKLDSMGISDRLAGQEERQRPPPHPHRGVHPRRRLARR